MPGETNVGALTVYLKANMRQFATSMQKASMTVKNFSVRGQALLSKFAASVGHYLQYAIPLAVTASLRAFAKLDRQMSMVGTMLDKQTRRYLPQYERELRKMSVSFGESTATLSKGLYDILSASIPAAEAMDVLTASVKAAKAGFTDTAVSADAITTILNSYQLSADKAADVSDLLFAVVKKGKLTFSELASSIGVVASVASTAGLSLEEVGATIATMTRAGLRADIAVTALRQTILAFLDPQDEAVEAAKEFGLELSANTLRTEGLTGVMRRLNNATAEQIARIIPSARAMTGFAAALKQSANMAADYEFMLNRAGQTEEAFKVATDNAYQAFSRFWQLIKDMAADVGKWDALITRINQLVDAYERFKFTREAPFIEAEIEAEVRRQEALLDQALHGRTVGPVEQGFRDLAAQMAIQKMMTDIENIWRPAWFGLGEVAGSVWDTIVQKTRGASTAVQDYGQKAVKWFEDLEEMAEGFRMMRDLEDWMKAEIEIAGRISEPLQHARMIVEYQRAAAQVYGESTAAYREAVENFKGLLDELEMTEKWRAVTDSMAQSFSRAMSDILFEAKNAEEVIINMLKNLAARITEIMMFEPLARGMAGLFGGFFGGLFGAPVMHRGGAVGAGRPAVNVPALAWAGAPRLHAGLRADEFPAILQRGETVVPSGAVPAVTVNVINETTRPVTAEHKTPRMDGSNYVTDVVIRDANTNGPITHALMGRIRGL